MKFGLSPRRLATRAVLNLRLGTGCSTLFVLCALLSAGPSLRADTLYASGFGAGFANPSITEFTPSCFQCQFTTGLVNASGMAFDRSGNLYVADGGENLIVKYNQGGAELGLVGLGSGLNFPFGLAFDVSGNLFVSNTGTNLTNGTIFEFTPGGVQSLFAFGLAAPEGLAFDKNGNLFEADHSSGNIFEFTQGGGKSVFASGLVFPTALAFDKNGNLFVSSFGSSANSGAIYEFNSSGTLLSVFASGLDGPFGLAFDSKGNLF